MNWTDEDILRRNREVLGIGRVVGIDNVRMERDAHGEEVLKFTEYRSLDPVKPDLMPEWMFEAEATRILEEDGWRALRTDPVSDRGRGKGFGEIGMADHIYLRYARMPIEVPIEARILVDVLWVEFKSAKGKPTSKQLEWHTKERARGALTLIAGVDFPPNVEGFKSWYRASGLQRNG